MTAAAGTTDTQDEQVSVRGGRRAWVLAGVGGLTLAAGVLCLARNAYWFVVDQGWVAVGGDESELREPTTALVSMVPALLAIGLGALVVLAALREPDTSLARWLGALALVTAVLAPIAANSYPEGSTASVVGIEPGTGQVRWRTSTPATELFGVLSETEDEITFEGRIDHRGCRWKIVTITLDRASGQVTQVRELPAVSSEEASSTPRPTTPSPSEVQVEQGERPVVCRS